MTDAEQQEVAQLEEENDWVAVDDKFDRYIEFEAGLVTGLEAEDFNLEWHLQVCNLPTAHQA
jgi:hypothetical protein